MHGFSASFVLVFLLACSGSSPSNDTGSNGSGDSGDNGGTGNAGESGEGGDGGEGGEGGEGGDGDPPAFEPMPGEWNFVDGSILSDSCDYDYDSLPSGGDGFSLSLLGNQDFEIVLDGTTDGFQCAWDAGQGFQCTPVDGSEDIDDLDAVIVSQTLLSGLFSEASAMNSTYNIALDCQGDDCEWVEYFGDIDFPCVVEVELMAESAP